jgi:hypothetical protein
MFAVKSDGLDRFRHATFPILIRRASQGPLWAIFIGGTLPSISQPLIHIVLQRLALLKPAILLQKEAHRLILPVGRVVRAVRRQQNIFQLEQQMSRR